ncbi:MAG TPA: Na+/H+ antiporter NhaC [Candidatus Aminicenantes bacterium]|nr:MAG: Na+/H+ antiporter NhaC [Candidatus Aminicenantes bacterium]HEK86091.1 Na+/H+ antiporter NhaC [Candidatus Aminicenantes bacterium]
MENKNRVSEEKHEASKGSTLTPRKPGFGLALIPLVAMALLLGVGYGVYRIKAQVLLIAAAFITACLGALLKFSWKDMESGIVESIRKALPAILIMLSVGVLVASWMASGTIPMIVYYGLKLISPKYFLVTACFVCSITSLACGTSWGTIGTLGVAFIGIAMGLGIPLGPAAGAIVAGSYFGDKMSPLSDIPNLASVTAGSNLFDHIKHMVWSGVPAWFAGLVIYFFMGLKYGNKEFNQENIKIITSTLARNFDFNLFLLLPILIVFYFAWAKKPTIPGMIISSLVAAFLAVIYQKTSLVTIAQAMNSGYVAHTGVEMVDRLISRGGLMGMMETQLIAFTAFSFGGIMQKTGMLAAILSRIMKFADKVWSLVLTTIGTTILSALITGSSYLAMIIPAELLAEAYKKKDLAAKNLSRIIEESGGIIVPLIPWSMAGVYITGTIGVPTFSYLPYTFSNYLAVIILAIYGLTGFTIARKIRDDETQPGS